MEHKDVQTQINEIENDSERKIAKLLYDIGFNFVSANSIITNNKNIEIGEIDLLFTHDDYLLIIEVSTATHKKNDKISSFFNKWSDRNNMDLMLNKHELSSRKTIKIYFDLGATEPTSSHAINILLENDSLNKLANHTDYMYFKEQCELIGHWSKNDFLNWLDLENTYENKPIDAIQFINTIRVTSNSNGVNILLQNAPYVDCNNQRCTMMLFVVKYCEPNHFALAIYSILGSKIVDRDNIFWINIF